ncbi:MAG: putative peptidoglycan glycosyltransferase FtsW [Myxococcota bacterium]|nr:putative peptidoglycan glycosyltransferase FtsW [Myxococcota bacterium]
MLRAQRGNRRRSRRPAGWRERARAVGPGARRAVSELRGAAAPRPRDVAGAPPAAELDGAIVTSAALLAGLGLVMIYSTTAPLALGSPVPPHFLRHLAGLVLAGLALVVGLRLPLAFWRRVALPLWALCVLLLLATLAIGVEANGARRWLAVPGAGLSLQPAELARFATPLAVASLVAALRPGSGRLIGLALVLTAAPVGLLLLQPDLGSAALLALLVGVLLFASGAPLLRLFSVGGLGLAGIGVYVALRPYALARWKGFLDPWTNAHDEGFQLVQSFVAFGRGQSFGVGLGEGLQKLAYLPEAHTDFILSVVAEELGLVGVLVVLGAFAALAVAGLRVARRTHDPFASLVAFAMTALVVLPAAVNAGVVMGLLPTTGFTLPFLSFGSNSLVVCSLGLGILLRVAALPDAGRSR